eukprot:5944648-Ditylum_brightwellii.AAC.1
MSTTSSARSSPSSGTSMIRSTYSRSLSTGSTSSAASSENLPPRTLARVAREVRDLHRKPPEGVRLVVDAETGMPASLGELVVSTNQNKA